jgi:hypothetical protein
MVCTCPETVGIGAKHSGYRGSGCSDRYGTNRRGDDLGYDMILAIRGGGLVRQTDEMLGDDRGCEGRRVGNGSHQEQHVCDAPLKQQLCEASMGRGCRSSHATTGALKLGRRVGEIVGVTCPEGRHLYPGDQGQILAALRATSTS